MLLLGIETSSHVSSVAFGTREGPIAATMLARGRGHVEFLMPAILDLAKQALVRLDAVTGVAVGLGPGMFTAMRVGIATAKTIAQSLNVPIVGLPSLDVIAFGLRHSSRLIVPCIDARREQVYAALYRATPGGVQRQTDLRAWDPDELAAELVARKEEVVFVGDGATTYAAAFRDVHAEVASASMWVPAATHLVELAVPRFEREEFTDVAHIEPLYVRKTDAEIKWEARGVVIERPLRVKARGE